MNEEIIIQRIKAGETDLLSEIYVRQRLEFINWIIKDYGADEEEAKDLYQSTILILYNNIRTGKLTSLTGTLKTYLFAVGRNQFLKKVNKESRYKFDIVDNILEYEYEEGTGEKEKMEKAYEMVELCMSKLGDSCRELLELSYFKKLSMSDIAKRMGYKGPDTAKNLRYKCMKQLKKLFGNEYTLSYE